MTIQMGHTIISQGPSYFLGQARGACGIDNVSSEPVWPFLVIQSLPNAKFPNSNSLSPNWTISC